MSRSYAFAYDRAMGRTASTRHDAHERTAVAEGASNTPGTTAVPDPQVDEDELVQRIRDGAHETRELAETWRRYASSEHALAKIANQAFDAFLHEARAGVRDAAAALLLSQSPADAAALMMRNAAAHRVGKTSPLIGFDNAAEHYTIARTWQACAWALDPSLPEIQPYWD